MIWILNDIIYRSITCPARQAGSVAGCSSCASARGWHPQMKVLGRKEMQISEFQLAQTVRNMVLLTKLGCNQEKWRRMLRRRSIGSEANWSLSAKNMGMPRWFLPLNQACGLTFLWTFQGLPEIYIFLEFRWQITPRIHESQNSFHEKSSTPTFFFLNQQSSHCNLRLKMTRSLNFPGSVCMKSLGSLVSISEVLLQSQWSGAQHHFDSGMVVKWSRN